MAQPSVFDYFVPPERLLLYRQFFTSEEVALLNASPPNSAVSEIYLIRVRVTRLMHAARSLRLSLRRRLSILTVFCKSAATIASLARFELKQQPPPPTFLELLYADMDPNDL